MIFLFREECCLDYVEGVCVVTEEIVVYYWETPENTHAIIKFIEDREKFRF
jgi:hypothetical protein